ncbi:MAG: hypothetical protein ABIZ80_05325 [Bryobacteraceae bacterium]
MPCFAVLIALAFPRVLLALMFFFSSYLERAYHGLLWPFLGFVFLPLTTIAYAWALNSYGSVEGFSLVVVVLAALIDLGMVGGAGRRRR